MVYTTSPVHQTGKRCSAGCVEEYMESESVAKGLDCAILQQGKSQSVFGDSDQSEETRADGLIMQDWDFPAQGRVGAPCSAAR